MEEGELLRHIYSSIKLAISVNQCELCAEGKTEEGGAPLEDGVPYVNEGIRTGATRETFGATEWIFMQCEEARRPR